VVFAAFFRVIGSAVFGKKPEGIQVGEFSWLTLVPPAMLVLLILLLGVYIPPQLNALLNGAMGVVTAGESAFSAGSLAGSPGFDQGLLGFFEAGSFVSSMLGSLH
jgi:type IV secretory pathway TrbL component